MATLCKNIGKNNARSFYGAEGKGRSDARLTRSTSSPDGLVSEQCVQLKEWSRGGVK